MFQAAALVLLPLVLPRTVVVQDPPPAPAADKRPEVATLLDKLKDHASKGGKEDKDAVAVIDQLNQEFPKSGPKDKQLIVKGLSKCFEQRRLEKEGQPPDNQLYLAAAVALGQMGPDSTDALISWIGQKDLRKDIAVQNRLLLSLGKTKDKKAIKELVQNLDNKTSSLISAAAEALGNFSDVDLDTRKSVFDSLLKILMSAKGAKDTNLTDTAARDKYDVIAAPIITSLGKLSKHDERDPDKWQTWWNKNKKADWDAQQ
jgi:HEAT repeat protein